MHLIGLALNEEVNQLKMGNRSFRFLEKTFSKDYRSKMLSSSLNNIATLESENYLLRSLENIVVFRREKVKDKENEDSCKLLAEWLIDYTKYLINIKFANRYEPVLDFNEFSEYQKSGSAKNSDDLNDNESKMNNAVEQRKAKMLKKLNQMQTKFMNTNKDFLEDINTNDSSEQSKLINDEDVDGGLQYVVFKEYSDFCI